MGKGYVTIHRPTAHMQFHSQWENGTWFRSSIFCPFHDSRVKTPSWGWEREDGYEGYFTLLFPHLGQGPPYNSFCRCINAIPIFSAPHHLRLHLKPRAASRLSVCMKGSSRLSLSTSFPESLKLNVGLILLDVWLSSLKFPRPDSISLSWTLWHRLLQSFLNLIKVLFLFFMDESLRCILERPRKGPPFSWVWWMLFTLNTINISNC